MANILKLFFMFPFWIMAGLCGLALAALLSPVTIPLGLLYGAYRAIRA